MKVIKSLISLVIIMIMAACQTTEPQETSSLVDEALQSYEQEENPERALEIFEEKGVDNLNSEEAAVYSSLLLASGNYEKGEEAAAQSVSADPNNTDALYNLALLAQKEGEWEKYRSYLEEILQINPNDERAYSGLGLYHLNREDKDKARDSFLKAVEIRPDYVAFLGLSRLALEEEENDKAFEYINQALALDDSSPFLYMDRGLINVELGKFGDAEDDLVTAVKLAPENPWMHMELGRLRYRVLYENEEALENFNKVIQLQEDNFFARVYRGSIYEELAQWDLAYKDMKRALEINPDYYHLYDRYCYLLYTQGQYKEAIDLFKWIYERYPDEHSMALFINLSYKKMGEKQQGKSYLEKQIRKIPRDNPFYELARYYISPGNDYMVNTVIQKITKESERLRMLFFLAAQYELNGMERAARLYYEEIAESSVKGFPELTMARYYVNKDQ